MAEYGEWNRKGATLSDVTAEAEYGVSRDFIIKGIQTGRLEYRDGAIWGNPYLRVLRSQLEAYIGEELGERYLTRARNQTELRRVKKEIGDLSKKLSTLQDRKNELEASLGQERTPNNALHRSGQAAPVSADSREPRRDAHFR
ncbi:MAG: hypothetical protein HYY05_06340 [Chloroflexi bacterium]|nr:hypothetical protein [Chloroflexota bacterium]